MSEKTKKVTLAVDFVVVVPEHLDESDVNQITFEIPYEQMKPMLDGKTVGHVESYCTQEYFGE